MKKYLIVYHVEDNDGVCSAAIILHHLLENLKVDRKEIDLLGSTYNSLNRLQANKTVEEKWPEEYDHIIMTDISFNDWKLMKWLYKTYGDKFTWIDHHAPIIKLSKEHGFDEIQGIRDTANSAIYNAYIYLFDPFKQNTIPFVVRMLSAWDSWTYEREGIDTDCCRKFNRGFTLESSLSVNWCLNYIHMILNNPEYTNEMQAIKSNEGLSKIYATGRAACDKEDDENKDIIRLNGDKSWKVNGIPAIFVVIHGQSNSLMFKSLKVDNPDENDLKVAIVAKHCGDGNWTISLYNIYDYKGDKTNPNYFHCGEYLQKNYNGGGHEGAAGCTVTTEKFCKLLKSKTI